MHDILWTLIVTTMLGYGAIKGMAVLASEAGRREREEQWPPR